MKKNNDDTDKIKNSELSILEKPKDWLKNFNSKWIGHLEKTGKIDWDKYSKIRNKFTPSGAPINLSESKIMLVSSSGAYLPASQEMFDQDNVLGDYSNRIIPSNTSFDEIEFSHTHYDHKFVDQDPQVLLPLRHMEDFVSEGIIGEIAPVTVSFSGYQPNVIRVAKELVSNVLAIAKEHKIDGVLLVPA